MKWKQINWRRIAVVTAWSVFAAGMLTVLGFVNSNQQAMNCTGINVNIDDKVQHDFIDVEEVLSLLNSNNKIKGKPIGTINISLLEKKLMSNPYVDRAEVYSTVDGKLQVNVTQRDPLVRIVNMRDEHYYIDRNGRFMPVSERYTTPVIVANGNIYDSFSMMKLPVWLRDTTSSDSSLFREKPVLTQVYEVAQFLDRDTFWNSQTEQIYVNETGELELVPRIGSHRIILGNSDELEEKFHRLYIFYTRGLKSTGWNNYSIINLKYHNQVVCTKNIN
jgi:cell division protein FtsQ